MIQGAERADCRQPIGLQGWVADQTPEVDALFYCYPGAAAAGICICEIAPEEVPVH